jgi:hypothetical protein
METPIIVYRPTLVLQPLDASGTPTGSPVDVSCDMVSAELTVDTPVTTLKTFCGTAQIPDDPEIGCTLEVAVNATTDSRWSALVGDFMEVRLKDRTADTDYRAFDTIIPINPALYGPDTPGEARQFSFDIPVLSAVTIVEPS